MMEGRFYDLQFSQNAFGNLHVQVVTHSYYSGLIGTMPMFILPLKKSMMQYHE